MFCSAKVLLLFFVFRHLWVVLSVPRVSIINVYDFCVNILIVNCFLDTVFFCVVLVDVFACAVWLIFIYLLSGRICLCSVLRV